MIAAYRLTPIASDGLRRIVFYVEGRFGPEIAGRVVDEFERAFERLASSQRLGHRRHDLTRDECIPFWSVGPTLIAYRVRPEWVEILFIERGELDWERMLAEQLE